MQSETQELKDAGLKITAPRVKIFQILESSTIRHMTAEDVYRQLIANSEDIGLATVYRVLTQFETAGLVKRHNFEEGRSVFELATADHHDHLLCVKCGRVEEFNDAEIETLQRKVAKKLGYELTDHNLNMFGLCPDCKANK
jgi:Fur family ferric uptake transcriptional regulator